MSSLLSAGIGTGIGELDHEARGRGGPGARGLHSSTSQLNVSAF
jgi:hypothetical protein